jgi:hypothetical protein
MRIKFGESFACAPACPAPASAGTPVTAIYSGAGWYVHC